MREVWSKWIDALSGSFLQFGLRDTIDILLVCFVIYQLIILTKETRAIQVIKGLGAIVVGRLITDALGLSTIAWLLNETLRAGSIALVVIFQPELRRALEKLGRTGVGVRDALDRDTISQMATNCANAMIHLSERQVGALIIFEGKTALRDIGATGTRMDAAISSALIEQIFEPNTPLHDGAAILQKDKIISAGCFLPLSEDMTISRQLGTRHRAALGVSEISDCLAFVVSEETGVISMAQEGVLTRYATLEFIVQAIEKLYAGERSKQNWLQRWFTRGE